MQPFKHYLIRYISIPMVFKFTKACILILFGPTIYIHGRGFIYPYHDNFSTLNLNTQIHPSTEDITEKDFGVLKGLKVFSGSEAPQMHIKGMFSDKSSMRGKTYTADEHLKNNLFWGGLSSSNQAVNLVTSIRGFLFKTHLGFSI